MGYASVRNSELRKSFRRQVEQFVTHEFDPDKPTILFIPGSPGSRLNRSTRPHDASSEEFRYDPAWVSLGMIPFPFLKRAGAAYDLRIEPDGQDAHGHIIVPDGTLHFVLNPRLNSKFLFNNYAKAKRVLHRKHNYFEFGCDFRRSVAEAAHWLRYVINQLRLRVFQLHGTKLEGLNLLCHSFGGMIGRVFLEFFPEMERVIDKFVTVGTPFFGAPNHFDFLYKGDPKINRFYTPRLIASIYATFPGPYVTIFSPVEIHRKFRDILDLGRYPLIDKASGKPVSPYCRSVRNRYPDFVRTASRYKYAYLEEALRIQELFVKEMPEAISAKTYHLLADGIAMPAYYEWADIAGKDFAPNGVDSPLQPGDEECPGDGSVYHWAACLPQVKCSSGPRRIHRCVTNMSHHRMLQSDEVLDTVEHLIAHGDLPGVRPTFRWPAQRPSVAKRRPLRGTIGKFSQQAGALTRQLRGFMPGPQP